MAKKAKKKEEKRLGSALGCTDPDDRAEKELAHRVHLAYRDELKTLYEVHANTLEAGILQSQAYRAALQTIENYRRDMIQRLRDLKENVEANGSPDGLIRWSSEKGHFIP